MLSCRERRVLGSHLRSKSLAGAAAFLSITLESLPPAAFTTNNSRARLVCGRRAAPSSVVAPVVRPAGGG